MFMFTEGEPQKTPEEIIADLQAQISDLKPKADASSQNFERLKKAEAKLAELEGKAPEGEKPKEPLEAGKVQNFDPAALEKRVEEKVSLRLQGYDAETIAEIEKYAKGAGIASLLEAAKSPFVQKGVDALRAEKKSQENTPAPSGKIATFNGKPVDEIFKTGTPAEKQAAWEATMKGGVKTNE